VKNLPSFCLLVGYCGYTAVQHSLHSVQTQREKKGEAKSLREHAKKLLRRKQLSPFFHLFIKTIGNKLSVSKN